MQVRVQSVEITTVFKRPKFYIFLFFSILIIFLITPLKRDRLYPEFTSFQILDREGRLLRQVLSADYKTSIWIGLEKVPKYLVDATILREDKRFFRHFGIDPLAILRAVLENIKYRRIVSGGSTITMQVAKMYLDLKNRNILTKLIEALYALKLELHLTKYQILEIYLNRAPYGNQNYGIEAASNFYFKKPVSQLSVGESCILAVIPKSPTRLNPYANPELVLKERKKLLTLLLKNRCIDSLAYICALKEPIDTIQRDINFEAPHFVDYILKEARPQRRSKIKTTLDLGLQKDLERFLLTTLRSLKGHNVNQGAILVMDVQTGEILSMVGSKDYFDPKEGQVNGCLSFRQPGSSIKPFLYILAIESGIPASYILLDTPLEFRLSDGTRFAPRNYGDRYHGLVRLREALGSSLNVPTVYLLERLGVQRFYNLLKDLNFKGLNREASHYGLSLALGAGEVSLLEMVNAYRSIAREGLYEKEVLVLGLKKNRPKRVFSRETAYIITDILANQGSRLKSFGEDSPLNLPFFCASKTGTSKDFRDNWCIGFTKRYVVGVWVGNFDGSPMSGISGISGAAPLFRDIMIELHRRDYPPGFESPSSLRRLNICGRSGMIAHPTCPDIIEEIFIPGTEPEGYCHLHYPTRSLTPPLKILNPTDGDIYKIDPQVSLSSQRICLKVDADKKEEVIFKLDGQILGRMRYPFIYFWRPSPGEHKFEVIGEEESASCVFKVVGNKKE